MSETDFGAPDAPITITATRWEGDNEIVAGLGGANGTLGNITASGNENVAVTPVAFVDGLAEDPFALEFWIEVQTRAPGSPPRVYQPGELVIYTDGKLYRATAENTSEPPPDHPESWQQLDDPVDDLRVDEASPYAAWGIR